MSVTRRTLGKSTVLFDAQPLWLDAMRSLVQELGMRVVGSTSECKEALEMVAALSPDVLIVGAASSDCQPLACVRHAVESRDGLKAIVVGESHDAEEIDEAFAAGATVYCVRTATAGDLATALGQAFEQSIFLATDGSHGFPPLDVAGPYDRTRRALTRREVDVLQLVAEGRSNAEVAALLAMTQQTVKFHLSNIYRKLRVANRTEASRWAQLQGLLDQPRRTAGVPSADVPPPSEQ